MLTSKQRADLRAQANDLDTTLMVGKGGVTENVLSEAARQLEARELVKGRVLEAALLSAREVCDALCEALGADGVQCVGSKFVIYRRSEKKAQEAARQARELKKRKSNPVRRGAQERRRQAREERERRKQNEPEQRGFFEIIAERAEKRRAVPMPRFADHVPHRRAERRGRSAERENRQRAHDPQNVQPRELRRLREKAQDGGIRIKEFFHIATSGRISLLYRNK